MQNPQAQAIQRLYLAKREAHIFQHARANSTFKPFGMEDHAPRVADAWALHEGIAPQSGPANIDCAFRQGRALATGTLQALG